MIIKINKHHLAKILHALIIKSKIELVWDDEEFIYTTRIGTFASHLFWEYNLYPGKVTSIYPLPLHPYGDMTHQDGIISCLTAEKKITLRGLCEEVTTVYD